MSLVLKPILKLLSRPVVCAPLKGLEINIYFYQFHIIQAYCICVKGQLARTECFCAFFFFLKSTMVGPVLYVFRRVKDYGPSLVWLWVRACTTGIEPPMLALLFGATRTSHENHHGCWSPQAP